MHLLKKMKFNKLQKKAMKAHLAREQRDTEENNKAEIDAQMELARFYEANLFDKGLPHADIYAFECYRAAAVLGSAQAQYICGGRLIEKGKFWDKLADSLYAAKVHKKYAEASYSEAFSFINESEAQGYPLAKRLHGLALVNGWGVSKDTDLGFRLVIESIDLENAWDRATKIFDDLGLNSPEFFAALRTHKPKI